MTTGDLGNAYLRGFHAAEEQTKELVKDLTTQLGVVRSENNRLLDALRTSNEWKTAYLDQLDALKAKLRELGRE